MNEQHSVEKAMPLTKVPPLVAGDRVRCDREVGGALRVVELLERTSVLQRQDHRHQPKAMAANVTHLAIISANPPGIDSLLVDQFCVAAETAGIEAMVVLNKADKLNEQEKASCEAWLETYRAIGYPVALINTKTDEGIEPMSSQLAGKTVVLVGASGVGKSSIVQRLLPDLDVRVGAVSEATGLGSHTTSVTFWYELAEAGGIIDSPGVRQFSVAHLTARDVRSGYREITAFAEGCKFANCSHVVEPSCAVKEALQNGRIAHWRYDNYRKLAEL